MSDQENTQQLSTSGVTEGWSDPASIQPSTIVITVDSVPITYYHSDTASAIQVWFEAASQASAQLSKSVVPHIASAGNLVLEAPEAFSITVGTDEAATKLGKTGGAGTLSSGAMSDGAFRISLDTEPQYTVTQNAGHAKITGFERSWSGGQPTSEGTGARRPIDVFQSIVITFITVWLYGYQFLTTWEEKGAMAFYDVSIGSNYIFRGTVESVNLSRAGLASTLCLVELRLLPVGI